MGEDGGDGKEGNGKKEGYCVQLGRPRKYAQQDD